MCNQKNNNRHKTKLVAFLMKLSKSQIWFGVRKKNCKKRILLKILAFAWV